MALVDKVSALGNIIKRGFVSKLEMMGKTKTTPQQEDVFANPSLETLGKGKFTTPTKYDPNK